MPKRYPAAFRGQVCQPLLAGEPVLQIQRETGVPESTLHRWKQQALIDAGRKRGWAQPKKCAWRP